MRTRSLAAAALLACTGAAIAASPGAQADSDPQVVTASLGGVVSISTSPTASVDFGTLSIGANTVSGGQVGVTSNVPYTLTVAGLKAKLTKYESGAYVDATALTTSMQALTTLSSGAGVPVPAVNVGTSAATIATGVGLGTDVFNLTLSQTVLISDVVADYRNDLTYTASETL